MVATLVQVLGKLSSFSTSCFADDDDYSVVSNDSQKLFSNAINRQEFPLLFKCFISGEFTDSHLFFTY